jgi:protein-S-isoprenylcysteine O-methyltransferase Ste14
MKATDFEFRQRTLLNLLQIWLAFQAYSLDRLNLVWWIFPWNTPAGAAKARAVFLISALLIGAAAAFRTWAAAYLGADVVHDLNLHSHRIVADGPYRHVRNPLYLGSLLLSAGLGFFASRLGFVILLLMAWVRILRLIRREEDSLKRELGEKFRQYARAVPRLLPSLTPQLPSSGVRPQWGVAFKTEAPMWGFLLMGIAFTVTLRDAVAWTLGLTSLLWWAALRGRERWNRRQTV